MVHVCLLKGMIAHIPLVSISFLSLFESHAHNKIVVHCVLHRLILRMCLDFQSVGIDFSFCGTTPQKCLLHTS